MYSIVRNPLYLGNFITIMGVLLSIKVWWLVTLISLVFFVYMERIIFAEEDYLRGKFGAAYDAWCEKTPVIIPRFHLWRAPSMQFSLKTVLKREYQGLLGVGTAFLAIEFVTDVIFKNENFYEWLREDYVWPSTYIFILAFCLTLRYLKKNTQFLKMEGR
jgi:hypothetical protein